MSIKEKSNNQLKNNAFYIIDEKNGIKCEYNQDGHDVSCYLIGGKGMDETVINTVIENFWDPQPEYYRTDYNTLM